MEINKLSIHPYIRLAFLAGGIVGTTLVNELTSLLIFYSVLIVPVFLFSDQLKKHMNFMLFGMLPIFLSFILLYIIILKGSNGDWGFINLKMMKLILVTSVIQITLSIPSEDLIHTFKKWGIKGEALITVLGAFTVWADITYRSEKIITARFSRGFVGKRTIFNKVKQFPFVMVPLVIGILRTSTERAESWEQKNILQLVNKVQTEKLNFPLPLNVILLITSLCWLLLGILNKLNMS